MNNATMLATAIAENEKLPASTVPVIAELFIQGVIDGGGKPDKLLERVPRGTARKFIRACGKTPGLIWEALGLEGPPPELSLIEQVEAQGRIAAAIMASHAPGRKGVRNGN
jgi:hypothetical protein